MDENREATPVTDGGQYSTFLLDGHTFGIEVLQVQEVLRSTGMTRVPLAPDGVDGLINLRGQIVTAIDLRQRLALPPRPDGQAPMNMVVRSEDGAVSLLVDEIGDVVEVGPETFEPPPDNIDQATRDLVTGVFKLRNRLLLVLDTARAMAMTVPAVGPRQAT